jgi:hypothetical protein
MADYDWQSFLRQWNQELLATPDVVARLPAEVVAAGWLGYPGATEAALAQAEARLGTRFPPSYRRFLAFTNGWRTTGGFIDRLWSTAEIEWFRVRHQAWIRPYTAWGLSRLRAPTVPDNEYFVYGPAQDSARFRSEYLPATLEISDKGDEEIYLLNPEVVTPDGEWEAWFFANWLPGAARYRSFWDLMQEEYASFLDAKAD